MLYQRIIVGLPLAVLLVCGLLAGCDRTADPTASALVLEGKTMGTTWRVSLADVDHSRASSLRSAIQSQLDAQDAELSSWKADSAVSRFNRFTSTERWPVSADMADIVTLSLRIGTLTQGSMDITIAPLVNLWGFGPYKAPTATPSPAQIAAARAQTGLGHLTVIDRADGQWLQKDLPELQLDLSTVGEGYAADKLAQLMGEQGISRYLVSVGGAVVSRGLNSQNQPWRVAIQKPTDQENAVQAIVDINGHGISTSGSYLNYYELSGQRISHVIDPASGRPITHRLVSATVIAPTALEADGWDTGLMVLGPEKAREVALQQKLAVYLITKTDRGFSTWMSPQFKAYLIEAAPDA